MLVSRSDFSLLPSIATMSQLPAGVATGILGGTFIGVFLNNILVSLRHSLVQSAKRTHDPFAFSQLGVATIQLYIYCHKYKK
jgi:hypothetical protein